MATDTRKTIKKRRDPWRSIYRFSAEQALAIFFPPEDAEAQPLA
jgi:hypothetical protein